MGFYSTNIDYSPKAIISETFFKTVQNKMHRASHGNTAAEVIYSKIDATKPNLGLTNFKGTQPTFYEIEIAKNYLTEQELNLLNRMVTTYLEEKKLSEHRRYQEVAPSLP